jgi:hypothetical protein
MRTPSLTETGTEFECQRAELVSSGKDLVFGAFELPLLDHVHRFDARDSAVRAVEVLETEHGPHDSFDRPLVVPDEVVRYLD